MYLFRLVQQAVVSGKGKDQRKPKFETGPFVAKGRGMGAFSPEKWTCVRFCV